MSGMTNRTASDASVASASYPAHMFDHRGSSILSPAGSRQGSMTARQRPSRHSHSHHPSQHRLAATDAGAQSLHVRFVDHSGENAAVQGDSMPDMSDLVAGKSTATGAEPGTGGDLNGAAGGDGDGRVSASGSSQPKSALVHGGVKLPSITAKRSSWAGHTSSAHVLGPHRSRLSYSSSGHPHAHSIGHGRSHAHDDGEAAAVGVGHSRMRPATVGGYASSEVHADADGERETGHDSAAQNHSAPLPAVAAADASRSLVGRVGNKSRHVRPGASGGASGGMAGMRDLLDEITEWVEELDDQLQARAAAQGQGQGQPASATSAANSAGLASGKWPALQGQGPSDGQPKVRATRDTVCRYD